MQVQGGLAAPVNDAFTGSAFPRALQSRSTTNCPISSRADLRPCSNTPNSPSMALRFHWFSWFGRSECLAVIYCTDLSPRSASFVCRALKTAVNVHRFAVFTPLKLGEVHLNPTFEVPGPPPSIRPALRKPYQRLPSHLNFTSHGKVGTPSEPAPLWRRTCCAPTTCASCAARWTACHRPSLNSTAGPSRRPPPCSATTRKPRYASASGHGLLTASSGFRTI